MLTLIVEGNPLGFSSALNVVERHGAVIAVNASQDFTTACKVLTDP